MDDHQTLSVAVLGSQLSSLLILIWLSPLVAAKAKNINISKRLMLHHLLMDNHQILSVAFLGSVLSRCSYFFDWHLLGAV
jgi:hypothetical protein